MDNIRKLFQTIVGIFQLYSYSRLLISQNYWKIVTFFFIIIAWRLFADIDIRPIEYWDERVNLAVIEQNLDNPYPWDLKIEEQSYWEKTPLWFVINILLSNLFGYSFVVPRVFNAMVGLGVFGLIFYIHHKYRSRTKALIALIVSFSIHQFFIINVSGYFSSHTFSSADLDVLQIFFILLSQLFLWSLVYLKHLRYLFLTYIALAFVWLAKGPLALLYLFVYSIYIYSKRFSLGIKNEILYAILLFIIIIIPWYVYMVTIHGQEFVDIHFGLHIYDRLLQSIEGHSQSILFYPSLLLNPQVSFFGIFFLAYAYWDRNKNDIAKLNFAITIIYFGIIMLMQTKIAWYILPMWIHLLLI
jgi:4-amino-4-deoxy-L-arabinose transferase-like glycosyltransferase